VRWNGSVIDRVNEYSDFIGIGVMSERLARKLRSMAFSAMLRREISWFDK